MKRKTQSLPPHVRKAFERVRSVAFRQRPIDPSNPHGKHRPGLEVLLDRAEVVLLAVASARSRPDGFPSSTPGNGSPGSGKGGGSTMSILDERGRPDPVPTSSTERAALDPGRVRLSPIDQIGADLTRELGRLDAALARIDALVARFDRLRSTADVDDAPQCHVASVVHRLEWDTDWTPVVSTTFAGYLDPPWPEERPVCRWVYDFTRRHHRIPTVDEMREYLARGAVRVKTGADTGAKP